MLYHAGELKYVVSQIFICKYVRNVFEFSSMVDHSTMFEKLRNAETDGSYESRDVGLLKA